MATTKKKSAMKPKPNPKTKPVMKNGVKLYGAAAARVLEARAARAKQKPKNQPSAKKNPTKKSSTLGKLAGGVASLAKRAAGAVKKATAKRPNASKFSSETPIEVSHHFRSGGPGFKTKRQRIIESGQRDLFAPEAEMAEQLKWLRRNPTILDAVQRKLGKQGFAKASPSKLKRTMIEVVKARLRRNPEDEQALDVSRGIEEMHEMFLGRPVDEVLLAEVPAQVPDEFTILGELEAVTYLAGKNHIENGEISLWEHEFGEEDGIKPKLCADKHGRLWIIGGNYRLTPRGIEN
jgi:hypothetical protein